MSARNLVFLVFLSIMTAQTTVNIISHPAGAELKLDGNKIGVTPLNQYLLEPGEYRFELNLEGYAPLSRELTVQQARQLDLEFRLNELHQVVFISKIPGVKFRTGIHSWDTKKAKLKMETGVHKIEVYAAEALIDSIEIKVNTTLKYIYDVP